MGLPASTISHVRNTNNRSKGTDNRSKGTNNRSKGTNNRSKGTGTSVDQLAREERWDRRRQENAIDKYLVFHDLRVRARLHACKPCADIRMRPIRPTSAGGCTVHAALSFAP